MTIAEYERMCAVSDERTRAVQGLKDEFLAAARRGDMSATAEFAPPMNGWAKSLYVRPLVREVLAESLDYTNGPQFSEVLSILCAVAYGSEPQVAAARELLDRMAVKWAEMSYEGE